LVKGRELLDKDQPKNEVFFPNCSGETKSGQNKSRSPPTKEMTFSYIIIYLGYKPTRIIMKTYPKEDIKVGWDASKCTHSANCVKGLPTVFDINKRPWINVDGATRQQIIDQVAKCPSGALSIIYEDEK